ncbi:hypothetical protein KHC33_11125 [Methanospirillum sp. J.3.6.1-F.2.7.3]|uniref:Uncharacterized protein n=1 Tax=Methanospirillum purgamenti TaxID=2834276 RepID=A0A8E7AX53_9EURY|nr:MULTISPECIES: UPF0175 family protein [Methanospirillum]MDX8551345.1 UPF0175 family protein [Methanospirillum hungatei]QVV87889.1 hypothetical protein KHC33_11125 [Methanospirillum sp. J.3.6.1-F.2.7.3]
MVIPRGTISEEILEAFDQFPANTREILKMIIAVALYESSEISLSPFRPITPVGNDPII